MAEGSGLRKLENWCKNITQGYKDVNIKDMSSSWRDGLAFCSIIANFRPDLIDFSALSKENVYHNNSLAFSVAEKQLGIPALLDAEDMVNCKQLDSLSIYTYLSELYKYFEGAQKGKHKSPRSESECSDDKERESKVFKYASLNKTNFNQCQACKNIVYILERLIVDGRLYHRSCFKCYKCDALLNPGAYLGDSPGTYECEICPKDEVIRRKNTLLRQLEADDNIDKDESSSSSDSSTEEEIVKPSIPTSPIALARKGFLDKSLESFTKRPQHILEKTDDDKSAGVLENVKELPAFGNLKHSESYTESEEMTKSLNDGQNSLENASINQDDLKSSSEHIDKCSESSAIVDKFSGASEKEMNDQSTFSLTFFNNNSLEDTNAIPDKEDFFNIKKSPKSVQLPVIKSLGQYKILVNELPRPNSTGDLRSILKTDKKTNNVWSVKRSVSSEENLDFTLHDKCSEISNSNFTNLKKSSSYIELFRGDEKISCQSEDCLRKQSSEAGSFDLSDIVQINDLKKPTSRTEEADNEILKQESFKKDQQNQTHEEQTVKEKPVLKNENVNDSLNAEVDENQYPEDLNPFDDDEENEQLQKISTVSKPPPIKYYPKTFNPFGSDEEDEVDSVSASKVPVIRSESKREKEYDETLNPFGSDDDETDAPVAVELRKPPVKQAEMPRKPTPAVRISLINKNIQESPVELSDRPIRISATPSPTGSLRSQKKRKAPAPPSPATSSALISTVTSEASLTSPVKPPRTLLTKSSSPKLSLKSKPAPPPPLKHSKPNISTSNEIIVNESKFSDKVQVEVEEESPKIQTSVTSESPKKKKRPAPSVPVPPRRQIKIIPIEEIHKEMEEIEKKQLQLEQEGKILELRIRNKDKEDANIESEDLVVGLFELLNKKNTLFRRRAELMHIKRSQRLEEEQADLEYQIRILMSKPNDKKTQEEIDKEQELLEKLIDVVEQRNEIVESIEMDRRKVAEEEESALEAQERKKVESHVAENESKKSNKSKKSKKSKKVKKDKEKKKKKEKIKEEKGDSQKTEKHKKKNWLK